MGESSIEQHPLRLLHVEDNIEVLKGFSKLLRNRGVHVADARCAADAVQSTRVFPADGALVDVFLPDRCGWDLIEELHGLAPQMRIFATSAHKNPGDLSAALNSGAVDFFEKPLVVDDFISEVHRHLKHRQAARIKISAETLEDAERDVIRRALETHRWNQARAAEQLGCGVATLRRKIDKYELWEPDWSAVRQRVQRRY